MGDLVESMKTAALTAVADSDPTCIMYGMVISTSPLRIQVNQKLILEEECLKLTRNVTDFYTSVTVEWNTESKLGSHSHGSGSLAVEIGSGGNPSHSHGATVDGATAGYNLAHIHAISGKKTIFVHNSLQEGEEVILIRQAGGQEYIVFDRVV